MSAERRPVNGGPGDGCARCTRSCPACPVDSLSTTFGLQTIEFGKSTQIVSTLKEISPEFKGISYLRPDFSPTRFGGGETPTPIKKSEENCSKCNEPASTCTHSESKTSALKAA